MGHGSESTSARGALDAVYAAFLPSVQQQSSALTTEILHQLDVVTQERRARIVAAEGTVPGILWTVLFWGAAVTISFTYFFGTQNLRAQTLMTGLLSMLSFSGLLVIIVIDHPFAGVVKVQPDALAKVLAEFGTSNGR